MPSALAGRSVSQDPRGSPTQPCVTRTHSSVAPFSTSPSFLSLCTTTTTTTMGILDKASEFIQGEQGQNLLNKLGGGSQSQSSRDDAAIQREDQQSTGGATSGFDSTAQRYTTTQGSSAGSGDHDDGEWEDDDHTKRRSASERNANAYSSSRGDFGPSGAAYGSTATPSYGIREAGADGAYLGGDDEGEGEGEGPMDDARAASGVSTPRNNPFGEGRDEQLGYEAGSEQRHDSSYGGGDRGIDFVASGGGSAYGDGYNEFSGAGRNNDGIGASSYEPEQPSEQRDGYPGGERSAYP